MPRVLCNSGACNETNFVTLFGDRHEAGSIAMGRHPIGKKAMTAAERPEPSPSSREINILVANKQV
jgi:hypothetical protein